ncbi:MAG TPA: PH domain-containing protein [Sphingomonadaceae bacterium]|nr:PH domain-containing protein [Sphingomonadaceae bacterium]
MTDAGRPAATGAEPETVADRRVHPATVPVRFLKNAPSALLGLPAAYAYVSRGDWSGMLAVAGVGILVVLGLHWLAWRRFRYGVGTNDVVIESGLLTRTRRSIPFDRIQDVDIERGPLQRLFGLATVRIETGGSASDEGLIDSVTLPEADALRAAVRAGKAQVRTGEIEAAPALPAARPIFEMGLGRVLVAGVFNFSLVYLAGLFGALQTFRGVLPFDIDDPGRWIGLVEDQARVGVGVGAIVAVALLAMIVGLVLGIARTLAADYRFRLSVEGARFRRTRGLFTRSDVVLPKARVQLALLRTGPLRRAFGWGSLQFQTLGGVVAGGQRQSVAPLATTAEMGEIMHEQGRLSMPDEAAMEKVSSRHVLRILPTRLGLPLAAILGASAVWPPALFALPLLGAMLVVAVLERRFHRYALGDDLLFIRSGVWRQELWIVPTARLQTLTLTRSWLQRRLGLASVLVDTAGAPMLGGPRIVDLSLARAQALMDRLARAARG